MLAFEVKESAQPLACAVQWGMKVHLAIFLWMICAVLVHLAIFL